MTVVVKTRYMLIPLLAAAFLMNGCVRGVSVEVTNPTENDRLCELAEIDAVQLAARLPLADGEAYAVKDKSGTTLPSQITSDGKLVFPLCLKASESKSYRVIVVAEGSNPAEMTACGRVYPERLDDLAWENDKAGFRAYGPGLQARGERGFGYDLFTKRGTAAPVLDTLYAHECDPAKWELIREFRKTDPEKAEELHRAASYHIDHGYGMDCYAVGPTLGAGVAALLDNEGEILYPWCWQQCEVLDNGPLRFRARLTFGPLDITADEKVVETRIITLDAGSHFNRTEVSYEGLKETRAIVSGIVLHDTLGTVLADNELGIIAYEDPTTGPDNGKIYLGHVAGADFRDATVSWFTPGESATRNNALGHVLVSATVAPESSYTYWWGFGWDRGDVADFDAWKVELETAALSLRNPLTVNIK